MKKFIYISTLILGIVSCKKEPVHPPSNLLNQSKVITIDSLRSIQQSVSPNGLSIKDSLNVYAIVTMDESNGNIYKNLYIQDHTAGIQVRLTSSSDFAVGDSLRLSLNGTYLSEYEGVIQLDSIDPENNIIKHSSGHPLTPAIKTIDQISLADEGLLIEVIDVQFTYSVLTSTYADAINQASENRTLEDCSGNGHNMLVRTSGFANFAADTVAQGRGHFTAIVGRFGDDIQLIIREPNEIEMTDDRCPGQILIKDFDDDDVFSGGWTTVQVIGTSIDWTTSTAGGAPSPYGVISNFSGTNTACENWLVSPPIDFSESSSPTLSFRNAYNYQGAPLQLLISTDYSGTGNPNASSWTDISSAVNWSSGSFNFVESGIIDLSAYTVANARIAFKYTGTNSDGSTWEIDDITING
ncbi:MAG: DUF5689 domain-containing protein [Crocinitomicaceae bacterium]|nr:DUF5689 domain-containing protein [Crocinitomicaceae bacterium]